MHKEGYKVGRRKDDTFKVGEEVVIVEIEDTGMGIRKENLEKVFEPFFTTKRNLEGTGLGLAITKNLIDMHKGFLTVNSTEGKGTRIKITLKVSRG